MIPRREHLVPFLTLAFLALTLASCDSNESKPASMGPPPSPSGYAAQRIASGLSVPVGLVAPPGDTSRVFIVEKTGTIRIYKGGAVQSQPFFTQTGLSGGDEQGLLGLAFHPQYATNGKFYVYYTDTGGDIHVVEYLVSSNPDSASSTSQPILFVAHPG
ncbi:MAG: PQQ-dependent sugar dehydrogenase, partial [Candidatus Eiseniibacteriota bacterium]